MKSLLCALKSTNTALSDLEALAGVANARALPSHLEIDFSSRCNYRCPMCHQAKLDMGRFQLDREALDALIDILPYVDTVMIAGLGEPLLYPGLARFLPYLRRYGCRSHLFTNGELIDRHLPLLGNLDRISISLDGATADTFEFLRQGGHFHKVIANLRALRSAAPHATLVTSTVVSRHNLHEVAAIVALAAQLRLNEVHLSPVDHTPALALHEEHADLYRQQLATAQRIAAQTGLGLFNNIHDRHFLPGRNALITQEDRLRVANTDDSWSGDASFNEPTATGWIHSLQGGAERSELRRRLQQHRATLRALRRQVRKRDHALALPYCSAPWKYGFARSRGTARLCPYADIDVGGVAEVLRREGYDSKLLSEVRGSMAHGSPCLSVCQHCTDDHRQFRSDSLRHSLHLQRAPAWRRWLEPLRAANSRG